MRNTPLHDNLPSNPLTLNARAIDPVGGHPQSGSSSSASFGDRRGSSAYSIQERLYSLDHGDNDEHEDGDEDDNEEEEEEEDEDDDALSSETRPVLAKTAASKRSVLSEGKAVLYVSLIH